MGSGYGKKNWDNPAQSSDGVKERVGAGKEKSGAITPEGRNLLIPGIRTAVFGIILMKMAICLKAVSGKSMGQNINLM